METVLKQLNAMPGVIGSMLCDDEGAIRAGAFPPVFDNTILGEAAVALADSSLGLTGTTGAMDMLDFRYGDGRIVVKPLSGAFVLLLCSRVINLQLLSITFNVAGRKLEKMLAAAPAPQAVVAVQAPTTYAAHAGDTHSAQVTEKGVILYADVMKQTASTFWESMIESVAINRDTSVIIADHFKTGSFKRMKLTNEATGKSKKFPVSFVNRDREHLYDAKVVMSQAALEALGANQGDRLLAEVTIGGGVFGWENI